MVDIVVARFSMYAVDVGIHALGRVVGNGILLAQSVEGCMVE